MSGSTLCCVMEIEKEDECFSFKPVELLVLEAGWNKGELGNYVPLVSSFIEEQEKVIRTELGPLGDGDKISRELMDLLLKSGTLDHASEMLDQGEEMLKELWIRGECGDDDRVRICKEWTQKYAKGWRRWRVLIYTFIATRLLAAMYDDIRC